MILELGFLIALSASPADAGAEPLPEPVKEEPRRDCKPPGSWDAKARECKPGCGIPVRWENGVQVGGCGLQEKETPELVGPACGPGTTWSQKKRRCE